MIRLSRQPWISSLRRQVFSQFQFFRYQILRCGNTSNKIVQPCRATLLRCKLQSVLPPFVQLVAQQIKFSVLTCCRVNEKHALLCNLQRNSNLNNFARQVARFCCPSYCTFRTPRSSASNFSSYWSLLFRDKPYLPCQGAIQCQAVLKSQSSLHRLGYFLHALFTHNCE